MKFNGRYIVFTPKDRVYITLKLFDGSTEFYSCTLPLTSLHNLVIGKLFIDIHGKSLVTNHTTLETCEMDWKERNWRGKNSNVLIATVKTASGRAAYKVQGKFSESLNLVNIETSEEQEIFRPSEKLDDTENMYQFSHFTLQLNYLP